MMYVNTEIIKKCSRNKTIFRLDSQTRDNTAESLEDGHGLKRTVVLVNNWLTKIW